MINWSKYVGLPQRDRGRDNGGVDCWGLFRLVYAEELGIDLPSYAGDYMCAQEVSENELVLRDGLAQGPWRAVAQPQAFDLLTFRVGRYQSHVACAIDGLWMLHVLGTSASVIERRTGRWEKLCMGIYRHEALL